MKRVLKLFKEDGKVVYDYDFAWDCCKTSCSVGKAITPVERVGHFERGRGISVGMEKVEGVELGNDGLVLFIDEHTLSDEPLMYILNSTLSEVVHVPVYGDAYVARVSDDGSLLNMSDDDISQAVNNVYMLREKACFVRMCD